jgi:hypothetical protein
VFKAFMAPSSDQIRDAVVSSLLAYDRPDIIKGYYNNKKGSNDYETEFITKLVSEPEFIKDDLSGAQGYIFETDTYFNISFRGTNDLMDVFNDINAILIPFFTFDCKVHCGVLHQFKQLQHCFKVETLKSKQIIVNGHSLGSALATLFSVYYCNDLDITCIGFGTPRVGDKAFVDLFGKSVQQAGFMKWGSDPICKIMIGDDYCTTLEPVHYGPLDAFEDIPILSKLPDHHILNYMNAIINNDPITNSAHNWWWKQLVEKIQFVVQHFI